MLIKRYTRSHEWVETIQEGIATIGITFEAQEKLGEIVYCELPGKGMKFSRDGVMATIESIKAVGELYCPIPGGVQILEINNKLSDRKHS